MPEGFGRAIVIGDACVDVTVPIESIISPDNSGSPEDGRVSPSITGGGTSANTAVALSKLSVKTAFMGTLGEDYGGRYMLDEFRGLGINTELTLTDHQSNTVYVFAFIDPRGERHLWAFPRSDVSYVNLDIGRIDLEKVKTASWVHSSGMTYMFDGTIRKSLPEIFKSAYEAGVPTSFDLNTRVKDSANLDPGIKDAVLRTLPYVKYLLGSGKDEFYSFCPDDDWKNSVKSFATDGRAVIARMGAEGSYSVLNGEQEFQKPFDVPVKNTTGAGDAFNAGFIAGMINGLTLSGAVEWGNAVASYKVAGNSSRHTPDLRQLEAFIANTQRTL